MLNNTLIKIKEKVISKLEGLGWELGTEYNLHRTVFVFRKPYCDNIHLWFGTKTGDDLRFVQYTNHPEQWPNVEFKSLPHNPGTVTRTLWMDATDQNEKPIDNATIAINVIKWLLIPEANIPNKWSIDTIETASVRRQETEFQKALKKNAVRRAAKAAKKNQLV